MPVIAFDQDRLMVRFSRWEALMVRRRVVVIPIRSIDHVTVQPGWAREQWGYRAGLVISGWYQLATFRHPSGTRRLVAMRRGLPLLRIAVGDPSAADGFDELVLSTPWAAQLAARSGLVVSR